MPALRPPPRFGRVDFEAFRADHPSQRRARDRVRRFASEASVPRGRRLPWRRPRQGHGLFLDGGFGVGKTHLLAAAWHASELAPPRKPYLSFTELVYLIGANRADATAAFAEARLICLDEFELDDPGNTLIVKSFLAEAFARGTAVLTTSNTPPGAQGAGRFNADDFQREIQSIASRFEVVPVDGPDARATRPPPCWSGAESLDEAVHVGPPAAWRTDGDALLARLRERHPIHYPGLVADVGTLVLDDLRPIDTLGDALRFVHFVDKLYDLEVRLRASGPRTPVDLFAVAERNGAFRKKFERCLSRLAALLAEPLDGG